MKTAYFIRTYMATVTENTFACYSYFHGKFCHDRSSRTCDAKLTNAYESPLKDQEQERGGEGGVLLTEVDLHLLALAFVRRLELAQLLRVIWVLLLLHPVTPQLHLVTPQMHPVTQKIRYAAIRCIRSHHRFAM